MNRDNIVPFQSRPPAHDGGAYQVVHYEPAAIHEGVPITALIRALNVNGFTVSNVTGRGLVIHVIGQDPEHPAPQPGTDEPPTGAPFR